MERINTLGRRRFGWWPMALGLLLPAAGCTSALSGAMYILKGYETPAEFKGLKGKNVVVVCRPPADDQYSNVRVPDRLAEELSQLLAAKVKKAQIVDYRKVARWTDENDWVEPEEVGRAVGADTVIAIDLNKFSIFQGPTLYQGQAECRVQVIDLANGGEVVFEKTLPPHLYPPNTGVPISEREQEEFRREYVHVLADHIGHIFYPYDSLDDLSRDSDAVLR